MKKYLLLSLLALMVLACNQNQPEKVSATEVLLPAPPAEEKAKTTRFKPPVLKANAEVLENDAVEEAPNVADQNTPSPSTAVQNPVVSDKKIINEGDISFETADVVKTRKQIMTSLKQLGGYAENDSEKVNGDENRKEYVLGIRIPAANFDTFLNSVSGTATKIDQKNIRVRDVTTEYIDTKTRLNNKLELEKRYLNLLNRAGKMRDLLDIEEKLTEIRSDIESTQSQLNYMSKQVQYSSLNISFYTTQSKQVNAGNGFGYKFMAAIGNGFDGLQSLFFALIGFWPFLIIAVLLWVVIKRRRKTRVQLTDAE
ncbi:DUF4349 domain-containing protein [Mucilaginibacter achroorhodeus]|uniref:DUF4349 domain-containing protein n=1 Tax=Mucilaginibacter achroorhodeus TaxID=2599294 RepID=A0A563UAZ2_9SPHI|nr:DUF4349 domain-containing protein [Mucilaginibacter achroorhodeus]TWR28453.1 DUF4349 domain-containing protein [Mucilaginibacter achroorhodeus]